MAYHYQPNPYHPSAYAQHPGYVPPYPPIPTDAPPAYQQHWQPDPHNQPLHHIQGVTADAAAAIHHPQHPHYQYQPQPIPPAAMQTQQNQNGSVDEAMSEKIAVEGFGILSLQKDRTMALLDFLDELNEYHASAATVDAAIRHMVDNGWVLLFRHRGSQELWIRVEDDSDDDSSDAGGAGEGSGGGSGNGNGNTHGMGGAYGHQHQYDGEGSASGSGQNDDAGATRGYGMEGDEDSDDE